jgi:hypothetical protein
MDFSCGIPVRVIVSHATLPGLGLPHLPQSANFYQKKGVGASNDIDGCIISGTDRRYPAPD